MFPLIYTLRSADESTLKNLRTEKATFRRAVYFTTR